METKYKITIPKPCHEDWNKMTPNSNGRFCGNCSKNVVDFTDMLPDEIQAYFQQHTNICGRFKSSQLESLTIQIPSRVLYSQTQYHKAFLLALFIAMGTTLFSCADKNGNKQKIEKVEVVEDSNDMNTRTVDKNGNKQRINKVEVVEDFNDMNTRTVGKIAPTKSQSTNSSHHQTTLPSKTGHTPSSVRHNPRKDKNCITTESTIMGDPGPEIIIDTTKNRTK